MRTVKIPGAPGEAEADWSATAELRESSEIKVRHRRLIEVAGVAAAKPMAKIQGQQQEGKPVQDLDMAALDLDAGEAGRVMALQDAVIAATIAAWSRPEPLPTIETVGDMDPDVYDALAQATREQGAEIAAAVDFEPNPDRPGFEQSPTQPSASSEEPSAEGTSESPETPPNGGESTATAPQPVEA